MQADTGGKEVVSDSSITSQVLSGPRTCRRILESSSESSVPSEENMSEELSAEELESIEDASEPW